MNLSAFGLGYLLVIPNEFPTECVDTNSAGVVFVTLLLLRFIVITVVDLVGGNNRMLQPLRTAV